MCIGPRNPARLGGIVTTLSFPLMLFTAQTLDDGSDRESWLGMENALGAGSVLSCSDERCPMSPRSSLATMASSSASSSLCGIADAADLEDYDRYIVHDRQRLITHKDTPITSRRLLSVRLVQDSFPSRLPSVSSSVSVLSSP